MILTGYKFDLLSWKIYLLMIQRDASYKEANIIPLVSMLILVISFVFVLGAFGCFRWICRKRKKLIYWTREKSPILQLTVRFCYRCILLILKGFADVIGVSIRLYCLCDAFRLLNLIMYWNCYVRTLNPLIHFVFCVLLMFLDTFNFVI